MRVLYLSQYFHPEIGATTNRAAAIALALKEAGHSVHLLCEMPNHPRGVIFPGYRGKFSVREEFHGIPVLHLPVIASPRKNFITRLLMYVSFALSASLYLALKRPRYDLLYVSSPPLFVAGTALLSKALYPRRGVVFEVRDLWPDSATEMGELNNRWLIRLSLALEKRAYRKCDLVVAATNYIGDAIAAKGTPRAKILVNRNGVDSIVLESYREEGPKREKDLYKAVFAGNMGLAQDLEPVIRCAELLQGEPVQFLFIGGGPCRSQLEALAKRLRLSNVEFRDQVPKAEIGKVLATADIGFVCLKDLPVLSGALPVKIFDYMAYRLPVLCAIRGEAAEVVTEAGAGVVVEPGNAQQMAGELRELIRNPELLRRMGESGRSYVLKHFQRPKLAAELVAQLEQRCAQFALRR